MVMLTKTSPSRPAVPESNPGESFLGGGGSVNVNTSSTTLFSGYLGEDESFTGGKPYSEILESPSFPPPGGDPSMNGSSKDAQTALAAHTTANGSGDDEKDGYQVTNTSAKYRSMMPPKLPIPSSNQYFTIPPGLSPATLLESPVLFSGGLVNQVFIYGFFCLFRFYNSL